MVTIPSEVLIVDVDTNTATCTSPPPKVLSTRSQREKTKQRIFAACPNIRERRSSCSRTRLTKAMDKSIPIEFKATYPKGTFRNINKVNHSVRPIFLGERLKTPSWYKHVDLVKTFDRIMLEKVGRLRTEQVPS